MDGLLPSDADIERALRRAWFPVARMADLEQPRRVRLLGETLVAYRTDGGEPRVAADRCAHRGASLADGHVDGDRIVCPYHGWQWRGEDGRCVHIPSIGESAGIPSKARIASHAAAERWGLVWCCLDEPAVELPKPPALDGLEWTHGTGRPMSVAAGLRTATENFRDVAHFPFVHRSTMGHIPEVVEPLAVERRGSEVSSRARTGRAAVSATATSSASPIPPTGARSSSAPPLAAPRCTRSPAKSSLSSSNASSCGSGPSASPSFESSSKRSTTSS